DVNTTGGPDPQHDDGHEGGERGECTEMQPARACDEQDRCERGRVDHGRPDIRLEEDEPNGDAGEPDHLSDRARLAELSRSLREKAREREDEQHLAELRRLEPEEAEIEPSSRAPNRALG